MDGIYENWSTYLERTISYHHSAGDLVSLALLLVHLNLSHLQIPPLELQLFREYTK